ncbi:MAG: hypothetical protein JW891_13665 [Candidatus Lokiarchaeota archaeon]|nr:hypothetical protein [Candidatus Lokiarchaeota archaeon]
MSQEKKKIGLEKEKEVDLIIINWKTYKSRIKFFDDIIARLRLEGTPICIGIYTLGFLAQFWVIYLLGIFYISGILCLDLLHLHLLLESVEQAKKIEDKFEKELLTVTHKLTSKKRTILHYLGIGILYATLFIVGIFLIIVNPAKII